jgi:hypothetical protein
MRLFIPSTVCRRNPTRPRAQPPESTTAARKRPRLDAEATTARKRPEAGSRHSCLLPALPGLYVLPVSMRRGPKPCAFRQTLLGERHVPLLDLDRLNSEDPAQPGSSRIASLDVAREECPSSTAERPASPGSNGGFAESNSSAAGAAPGFNRVATTYRSMCASCKIGEYGS